MRAIGIAFALGLAACSSSKTKPPPELGDCVPPPDGACARPLAGGGSTTGNVDSSTTTPDGSSAGSGVCADAGSLLNTMNPTCQPCIVANCCTNQICSGDCALLVQRAQTCMPGDTGCLATYEAMYQSSFTAYQDFAGCLAMFCKPGCPTLPPLP